MYGMKTELYIFFADKYSAQIIFVLQIIHCVSQVFS
jgi:hypothetical protein